MFSERMVDREGRIVWSLYASYRNVLGIGSLYLVSDHGEMIDRERLEFGECIGYADAHDALIGSVVPKDTVEQTHALAETMLILEGYLPIGEWLEGDLIEVKYAGKKPRLTPPPEGVTLRYVHATGSSATRFRVSAGTLRICDLSLNLGSMSVFPAPRSTDPADFPAMVAVHDWLEDMGATIYGSVLPEAELLAR